MKIQIGLKVHYIGNTNRSDWDNGVIKALCPDDPDWCFVTYNYPACEECPKNGEYCNCPSYLIYTSARTRVKDLRLGWLDAEGRCSTHRELKELNEFGLNPGLK